MLRHRFAIGSVLVCIVAAVAIASTAAARKPARRDAALAARLHAIRTATERFEDVNVALKEGYVRDPMDMCVTAPVEGYPPQLGGMGIHFFRPDLLGLTATTPRVAGKGTHTDFSTPGVLVYEPQAGGGLKLVAVENLVFADAWREAGHTAPPDFEGNQYYRMIDNPATTDVDEAHGFMPHYELHMWLYRDNPNGTFAQFNPNVTCRYHQAKPAAMPPAAK
jgi:hypothetical protein